MYATKFGHTFFLMHPDVDGGKRVFFFKKKNGSYLLKHTWLKKQQSGHNVPFVYIL